MTPSERYAALAPAAGTVGAKPIRDTLAELSEGFQTCVRRATVPPCKGSQGQEVNPMQDIDLEKARDLHNDLASILAEKDATTEDLEQFVSEFLVGTAASVMYGAAEIFKSELSDWLEKRRG